MTLPASRYMSVLSQMRAARQEDKMLRDSSIVSSSLLRYCIILSKCTARGMCGLSFAPIRLDIGVRKRDCQASFS